MSNKDIWAQLSAPLPTGVISWRQDGRPVTRDGKYFARFVAYVDSNTVRERLDGVVPGEWDLTLELLPVMAQDEPDSETQCAFKARLQILGVIREDVGHGRDYKQAATDAFKRASVRFGVAHELYSYEQNWVQVDGDGKYAKPVEDPGAVYARKRGRTVETPQVAPSGNGAKAAPASPSPTSAASSTSSPSTDAPLADGETSCPKCGGRMWDNRLAKRNPKAPDYKCRSRSCDGVIWPPKDDAAPKRPAAPRADDPEYAPLADEPDWLPLLRD